MPGNRWRTFLLALAVETVASTATAAIVIDEVFSTADGRVQYLVLRVEGSGGADDTLAGKTLTVTTGTLANAFTFPATLPPIPPNSPGADRRVLAATQGLVSLGLITPDVVLPDRFLPTAGARLQFIAVTDFTYPALPTDGVNAFYANKTVAPNLATNFAGQTASVAAAPVTAIEYYNAALDHFFISDLEPDISALESGRISGWSRTGHGFLVYPSQASGGGAVSPVCRFYIPPPHGDSHFFSASLVECNDVLAKIPTDPNYSGYVYESPNAFYAVLPNTATGACPGGMAPVYRLWNRRADSNHRYTTDAGIKAAMIAKGYVAEGYGPDAVSLCSPAPVATNALVRASGATPFGPGCDLVDSTGIRYANFEVEPFIAVNPANPTTSSASGSRIAG